MALENEVTPIHVSHWGLEDSLSTPLKGWSDADETGTGTPTREVTTSDEAAAAPVSDTKMMLDHEDLHGLSQNVSKAEIIDKQETPPTHIGAQALPGRLPSNQSTDEPQTSNITTNSTLSAPTPVFTPRRSPRHSTSSQQNGPASKEIAQIIATSSARASPLARMILPKPEFPFASATPFTLFSTPLPSPSIFQSRTSSPFSSKPIQDPDNSSFPSTQPEAPSRGDISQIAPLPLNNGHSLFSNNPDLTSEGNSTQSRDVEMNDTLEHQSGEASFTTHITSGIPNENSSDASQIADLSSIFASPIPKTLPPVLSPLRNQSFQSILTSSTPILHPSLQGTPNHGLTALSPVRSSFLVEEADIPSSQATYDPPSTSNETTSAPEEASKESDDDDDDEDVLEYRTIMTPSQRADRNAAVMAMQVLRSPERTSPKGMDSDKDPNALNGPLAPPTSPLSSSRLPYPITPQRVAPLGFVALFPLSPINTIPPQLSNASTPVRTVQGTPSRLPLPISSAIQALSLPLMPQGSLSLASAAGRLPGLSPLRQPSALKSASAGAASKIPRPGKKPYSKPLSRLPRSQALAKPAAPAPTILSPPPVHPKLVFSPPIIAPVPISPIKTRRGRANASQAITGASAHGSTELPPGIIIRPPPPPRIKEISAPEIVPILPDPTPAAQPPSADTKIPPPKSINGPPKARTKRTKQEVDSASAIPEFEATAPSLGIFPSPPRGAKGRGRAGVARPMMLPLDPTSLRHLTNSNTLRNQQYVCSTVQTKIIMKEGNRPASPTTRVKTLLEKKKEQKDKSREERAARRDANYPQGADQEMEDGTADDNKRKHPRAAGDDEDYETPIKIQREPDGMEVDEGEDRMNKKRVQWKLDLLQRFELDAANLDGIKKGAEAAKQRTTQRSCFTTKVILDPLGNVPDADVPIPDLPREQVVVTRLVYIDDLPPSERPKRVVATKAGAKVAPS